MLETSEMKPKRSSATHLADNHRRQRLNACKKHGANLRSQHSQATRDERNREAKKILPNKVESRHEIFVCHGCNQPIKDKFLLNACDKFWHDSCLKCHRCHAQLSELGSTLYERASMNLCRQDYFEMFGQKAICAVCDKLIFASEMVMRAKENVYHLECFACQLCGLRFCVGDRFHLCENKIVCQYDYDEHILPIQESMRLRHQQLNDSYQDQSNSTEAYVQRELANPKAVEDLMESQEQMDDICDKRNGREILVQKDDEGAESPSAHQVSSEVGPSEEPHVMSSLTNDATSPETTNENFVKGSQEQAK